MEEIHHSKPFQEFRSPQLRQFAQVESNNLSAIDDCPRALILPPVSEFALDPGDQFPIPPAPAKMVEIAQKFIPFSFLHFLFYLQ
jgi:hypothetical protein